MRLPEDWISFDKLSHPKTTGSTLFKNRNRGILRNTDLAVYFIGEPRCSTVLFCSPWLVLWVGRCLV